jgi:hypothetical protein
LKIGFDCPSEEVTNLPRSKNRIDGKVGLVGALQAQKFNFKSFDAQVMLKEAESRPFIHSASLLAPR